MVTSRILIAFNGSPLSIKSLDIGLSLASLAEAEIALVTVVNPKDAISTVGGIRPKELLVEMRINAHHKLAAAVGKINPNRDPLDFLTEGDPATEIVRAAKEWGAQMIVLGFHPHSRLEGVLFGSTTEAVLQRAQCPVLVVPESTSASSLDW